MAWSQNTTFTTKVTAITAAFMTALNTLLNRLDALESTTASHEHAMVILDAAGDVSVGPKILIGSVTDDPSSIAANASESQAVTVTDAVTTDIAMAFHSGMVAADTVYLNAEVTAAETVTVTYHNPGTGAVDIASGTLSVVVFRAV